MTKTKKKKMSVKEMKFVKGRVEGKTQVQSYKDAGYARMSKLAMSTEAKRIAQKPHIQQAINDALEIEGATPQWAVRQIKKVAEQDVELASKRLAAMNILELHGWNKSERPTLQLQVENAFFGASRKVAETQVVDNAGNHAASLSENKESK